MFMHYLLFECILTPHFCVFVFVLLWTTLNQVPEYELEVGDDLFLFSFLSFGSIVGVALIRNMRGSDALYLFCCVSFCLILFLR